MNATLRTMRPELVSLSEALAQAASSAGGGYAFEGQCGVGSYRFQGTELYLLAAVLRLGVAASQFADAYDLDLPVRASLDAWLDREATESWIREVNERYLRVDDPDAAAAAGPHFARGLRFLQAAVESAQSAGQTERGDATFDWGALPSDLLADLAVAMASAQRSLESGGVVVLPQLEPALAIDLGSVFSDPIQRAAGAPPFARLEPDEWEGGPEYLVFDWSALSDGVNSRLSPAVFSPGTEFEIESDADITWSSAPVWNAYAEGETGSLADVLDPDGTWSLTYSCSDNEPRNGDADE